MHRSPIRTVGLAAGLAAALLAASAAVAACGSTSTAKASESPVRTRAIRVRFVDWRSNQNLVLLDQSHTDRAELYSSTVSLAEAGTKVTTDEVLEETLRFFREQGYFERATAGPAAAGGDAVQSIEVETPDGVVHLDYGRSTAKEASRVFRTCRDNFVALYNNVYQLQSVDRVPDWDSQNEQSKKLGLTPPGEKRP